MAITDTRSVEAVPAPVTGTISLVICLREHSKTEGVLLVHFSTINVMLFSNEELPFLTVLSQDSGYLIFSVKPQLQIPSHYVRTEDLFSFLKGI